MIRVPYTRTHTHTTTSITTIDVPVGYEPEKLLCGGAAVLGDLHLFRPPPALAGTLAATDAVSAVDDLDGGSGGDAYGAYLAKQAVGSQKPPRGTVSRRLPVGSLAVGSAEGLLDTLGRPPAVRLDEQQRLVER